MICRQRKIKCDERHGGCANCERLDLECPGYDSSLPTGIPTVSGSHSLTEAGFRRRRALQSCVRCRISKTKCSGGRPICSRCRYKGFNCVFDERRTARQDTTDVIHQRQSQHGSTEEPNEQPNLLCHPQGENMSSSWFVEQRLIKA